MRSLTFSLAGTTLIGAALLGAGCAVGPNFHRPPAPAVSSYTPPQSSPDLQMAPQRLVPGGDIQAEWWRLFHAPKLDALIARALVANSDLAAAQAALRAAHQTYLSQAGVLLPTIDASASSTRNKSSQYLSPVLNANQFYYTLQTAQLNIGYTFDVFGGLRRQRENAKAEEEMQRFQTYGTYLTLISNLVSTAVQDASLRAQIDANDRIIQIETGVLSILRQQLALGQINRSDVLAQEAALSQAKAVLPPLQKQLALQRDLLAYLTGRTPGEGDIDSLDLDALSLPEDLPLSLPSKLVEQRPDIRVAEANLHAASAAVGVAIAARLPSLTLTGSAGGSGDKWSNLLSHGTDFWSYGAGVAQPIFEGGALYRKQKAAEASLDQAKALYRSAVLSSFQNVADVLQALALDAQAVDVAVTTQKTAADSLDITRRQLIEGQITGVELLNAEQTFRQANLALIQAKASRLTDTAALFQALGGGWWNKPQAP